MHFIYDTKMRKYMEIGIYRNFFYTRGKNDLFL